MTDRIVIVSEVGWQGARELSIELSNRSVGATNLIKGRPEDDVIKMITRYKEIKNIFIVNKLFVMVLFIDILCYSIFSKRLFIFTTKEKTEKRLLMLGRIFKNIRLARLREAGGRFTVFDSNMNSLDYKEFLGIA
ncbi:MAG: hypothetical protein KKG01_03195 [Candidatus Omnitrophica bacterium]|nr:hypothetical protein [Candidatus Omnitrophota bacterium]